METKRKFIPLNKYVLVRSKSIEQITQESDSGFISEIVDDTTSIPEAVVVESNRDYTPELLEGDTVVYDPNQSIFFILNGEQLQITNFENIFGKIV